MCIRGIKICILTQLIITSKNTDGGDLKGIYIDEESEIMQLKFVLVIVDLQHLGYIIESFCVVHYLTTKTLLLAWLKIICRLVQSAE